VIEGAEFFVILLVALVVFGPERLPAMARKLGGWTAELRKAARELREGLEAEVGDVREIAKDIRGPIRDVEETVRETRRTFDDEMETKRWVGPKPLSGPTPEDAMRDLERIEQTGGPIGEEADDVSEERPEPEDAVSDDDDEQASPRAEADGAA
jgi:sec-independent protein translocase protein TatB